MTMQELARLTDTSLSTVSKAFSGAQDISAETREHIFSVARETGCFGKFYKGHCRQKVIAILCPELRSSYYIAFVEILQRLIEESGGIPLITTDHFKRDLQSERLAYFSGFLKADGILVFGLNTPFKKGFDTPVVSLFSSSDAQVDSVDVDCEDAVRSAIDLLQEQGHQSIAYIGETLTGTKNEAFRRITSYRSLQAQIVISPWRFEQAGIDGVGQLLASGRLFTALVCGYDNIAFGAVKSLTAHGLSVPEDVSVIGLDNISSCEYANPPLTSISADPEEVCRIAWDLLQKKINNPYFKSRQSICIAPRLTLRSSVCPPRH